MNSVEWLNRDKKIKIDVYEEELEQAHEHYIAKVLEIAARARRELVIPWLKLTGCEFTTGNGTWSITDPSKIVYLRNGHRDWRNYGYDMTDNLPPWLDRLLRLEVEGSQGNGELALWMIDYTIRKTKNRGGLNV